jgi:uncharacterized integral membrane protein
MCIDIQRIKNSYPILCVYVLLLLFVVLIVRQRDVLTITDVFYNTKNN